jgi:hypothetical protein
VGHIGNTGAMRNAYKIFVGISEDKRPLGALGVEERIILKIILNK